jgi:hypothetical protein
MATTDAEALLSSILAEKPRSISTKAFYSPEGDCIFYYVIGGPHDAVRIDGLFTLYVTGQERKFAGFEVKGVSALVAEVVRAISAAKNQVELRSLLVAALSRATSDPEKFDPIPDEAFRVQAYSEAIRVSGDQNVQLSKAA